MEFISSRLKLGMFLRNETVTSLAKKAELSKQAISKFQNGELKPSKGAVLAIAYSLELPVIFFNGMYVKLYEDTIGYEIDFPDGKSIKIKHERKNKKKF